MRLVAYVDAMYRPTDKLCGYGFLVEKLEGGSAEQILIGNKFLPYSKQGSAQTEIMAIEDFIQSFGTTLPKPLDCIYTDSEGILSHLKHIRTRVAWTRRDSEKIQTVHSMAQKLRSAPNIVGIPSFGVSIFHAASVGFGSD